MDQLDSPQELFEVAAVEHRRFNPYRRPKGALEGGLSVLSPLSSNMRMFSRKKA